MTTIGKALQQTVLSDVSHHAEACGLISAGVRVGLSEAWAAELEFRAAREVWPAYQIRADERAMPPVIRTEANNRVIDALVMVLTAARRALYQAMIARPGRAMPQAIAFRYPGAAGAWIDAVILVIRPPGHRVCPKTGGHGADGLIIVKRSELPADIRMTADTADDPLTLAWLALNAPAGVAHA